MSRCMSDWDKLLTLKNIYKVFYYIWAYLECGTSCLLILVDSWMILRAYPENGRSIGQENNELS